jgi:hypothetical protein
MSNRKIVFCSTCKNRYQHLRETIPKNLRDNVLENSKFVVVDYCSGDDMAQSIKSDHMRDLESGRLVYYKYHAEHSFRMAHAKNIAHRLGILEGGDILVNLDADNFTEPDFDKFILEHYDTHGENSFLWANMIKGVLPKGISGRIVVTKNQFILSGGYDEKYRTYSPDDKDFRARLIRLGFDPFEVPPSHLNAIRHNDKMRFKEYPEAKDADAEDFGIDQWNRVVNYGDVGCGLVSKNFSEERFEVEPIPTRIFGIGMHKTATTSLHTALQALGIKSAHWKDAHWAKSIWSQMNSEGRSLTVEKNYAVSDLPIPVLFKGLDRAYPGSKFILTKRPEQDWLESVRKHFDPTYNPQQKYWKKDPFTHIIHRAIYGQNYFEPELFLRKYQEHNEEVMRYFANRPNDLFVMENTGWDGLCKFLGVPIPEIEYPQKNLTPKH